jgi:hypothetical protein
MSAVEQTERRYTQAEVAIWKVGYDHGVKDGIKMGTALSSEIQTAVRHLIAALKQPGDRTESTWYDLILATTARDALLAVERLVEGKHG